MEIKIKKLSEDAIIPAKATAGSAAYDIYCPRQTVLHNGRQVVSLGIALEIPQGYEAKIEPRSGYSSKGFPVLEFEPFMHNGKMVQPHEIRVNADVIVGKIDSDYRGEIGVIVKACIDCPRVIAAGQKIAQMTIYKVEDAQFREVDKLSETQRGDGGFGHSGN